MDDKEIVEINLNSKQLNEGWLQLLGRGIQRIMKAMFGGYSIPVNIHGTQEQINSFAKTLESERNFIDSYRKYGLDAPRTYQSKYQLNKAVSQFERATGLKWPFR